MNFRLERAKEDFTRFCIAISAKGNFQDAFGEFNIFQPTLVKISLPSQTVKNCWCLAKKRNKISSKFLGVIADADR